MIDEWFFTIVQNNNPKCGRWSITRKKRNFVWKLWQRERHKNTKENTWKRNRRSKRKDYLSECKLPTKPIAYTCDSILLTCNVRIYLLNAWNFQGRKPYDESSWNTYLDDRLPFALTHEYVSSWRNDYRRTRQLPTGSSSRFLDSSTFELHSLCNLYFYNYWRN